MAYLGGKARNAKHILDVLNSSDFDGMDFLEPFLGYGHILRRVVRKESYTASDSNPLLMLLMKAVQRGEALPRIESREEYLRLKEEKDLTLKHSVACFTYSYNGKAWGGWTERYVRRDGCVDDIPQSRFNYYEKLASSPSFRSAFLEQADYRTLKPVGKLIFCDPPYRNSCGYGQDRFDSDEFWNVMRVWSRDNVVYISEYEAPSDFVCVASALKSVCVGGGNRQRVKVEKLWRHHKMSPDFHQKGRAICTN